MADLTFENLRTLDVLFVVTTLGPGGTEYYVENMAVQLKHRGMSVAVLADSEPLTRLEVLQAEGVPTEILGVDASWTKKKYQVAVEAILSSTRVRLVHVNMWLREDWLRQVVNRHNIPVINTAHETILPVSLRERLGVNRVPFYLYRRRAILHKKLISTICISDVSLKNFKDKFGKTANAVRVYCGGPSSNFTGKPSERGKAPRIVWLGSMTKRKRPILALDVFREIHKMFPGTTLLMIGKGELRSEVERVAATFPPGVVQLAGYVDEVSSHLATGQVLIHTSAVEGTPTAIREAMSVSLPVVATDAGASNEVVLHGKTGFITPVDDTQALVAALAKLVADPELRARFGQAGRVHFNERFALSGMIDETIEAYNLLAGINLMDRPPRDEAESDS